WEVFHVRVAVTGGAGFIGSNLAKRLAADGHDVVAADSFLSASWQNLSDFNGDVLTLTDHDDVDSLRRLEAFEVLFHQAIIVGLRYSNVYGPGEDHKGRLASMIHQLARQMRSGKRPRIFTAGQQKRDFVYIDDVVEANIKAMTAKESGVFNAGAGRSWTFNEV